MDLCCLITVSSGKLGAVGIAVLYTENALGMAWGSLGAIQSPAGVGMESWRWLSGGSTALLRSWVGPTSPGRSTCPVLETGWRRRFCSRATNAGWEVGVGILVWLYWCGSCQPLPQLWGACLLLS